MGRHLRPPGADGVSERGVRRRRGLSTRGRRDPARARCAPNAARRPAWGLAKGAIEPGESEEQAAVREVLEETGLEVEVESDLGDIRYFYVWEGVRVRKRVHFFLMRATGGDVTNHDAEMEDVRWFPLRAAIKRAAYKGEREVIERAVARLS
ncbi:MAG: NUDIX domain-containing protein [Actinobacteria bacterium]|nr:MAG: NUDIX domain-containing protein [Actinomycetota bacterium]